VNGVQVLGNINWRAREIALRKKRDRLFALKTGKHDPVSFWFIARQDTII